jgi:ferredoxin-NADP reductase/Na+-translocating ferredoxin:NAD+ oxidoreductase RnfD subunit
MYRLVLYYLVFLLLGASALSAFGILPYSPLALLFSTFVLLATCLAINYIFARVFKVQTNIESAYITALILALIIDPPQAANLFSNFWFLFWAAALAMASKYIVAIKGKHIFNPAAFAVAVTAIAFNQLASWWVGSASMLAFVAIGGFLVIRKVQRSDAVTSFILVALTTIMAYTFMAANPVDSLYRVIIDSPLIFFAAVMLTEPLTMPPTKPRQVFYAALVGFAFAPQVHFGSFYFSPETALLLGNIFSYLISPKGKYVMTLVKKEEAAEGVYNFTFAPDRKIGFRPGQYLEWTLGHDRPDTRGNRRYFTIASSPTEETVMLGVKFYDKPSSFKQTLRAMNPGDTIMAAQLAGGFVLPRDPKKKLVFIAGGIGITPFRSMLKYLADNHEKRSITLIYSSASMREVAYYDIFQEAAEKSGINTVFTFTDKAKLDPAWKGHTGYVNEAMIEQVVPDYRDRTFYVSGPHTLIDSCNDVFSGMGIPRSQIKTDFFPGLA